MPSLASVTFDASGFHFQGERDGARVWHTPAGDALGIFYFPLKPDIGADVRSVEKIRQAIRPRVTAAGAAIIELETTETDSCLALRQIIKVPQQPHGMTYVGSLLLPFRDFSFVIKVQCQEHGTTGMRDAIIANEALGDGRVTRAISSTFRIDRHARQKAHATLPCPTFAHPFDPTFGALDMPLARV